jgi:hypothetical protein
MATVKELKAAILDLNENVGFDPAIISDGTKAQLEKAIIKNVGNDLYDTDKAKLTEETWELLTDDLEIDVKTAPEEADEPEEKPKKADKKAPAKKADKKADKKAPAKKAEPKAPRYTRIDAMKDATDKHGIDGDRDKIFETANKLYAKNGGSDNLKEQKWVGGYVLRTLEAYGVE